MKTIILKITKSESDSESWIAALVLTFFAKFIRFSGISIFPAVNPSFFNQLFAFNNALRDLSCKALRKGVFVSFISFMKLKNLSAEALLNGKESRREIQTFKLGNCGSPLGSFAANPANTRFQ